MALVIIGSTHCGICGDVIKSSADSMALPAFVFNDADSLADFSDSAVHESCLRMHDKFDEVASRIERIIEEGSPEKRTCSVCKQSITNPDDYIFLGHISDDRELLETFNYLRLHVSCLPKWEDRGLFCDELRQAIRRGTVQGRFYQHILSVVCSSPGSD